LHIRMLMALAFVPTDNVTAAFDIVWNSMPDTCKPVAEYFESTYVRGSVRRSNRRRPPQFPPNIWNASERFAATLPTTITSRYGITAFKHLLSMTTHPSTNHGSNSDTPKFRFASAKRLQKEAKKTKRRRTTQTNDNSHRLRAVLGTS